MTAAPDEIREEIRSLKIYCEELSDAIDDFEHEARRCRERLERVGGSSHALARELKRLEDNRRHDSKELDRARRRIDALRKQLD